MPIFKRPHIASLIRGRQINDILVNLEDQVGNADVTVVELGHCGDMTMANINVYLGDDFTYFNLPIRKWWEIYQVGNL